ncbi:terminase small subunit [Zavarzinella formosa]|uniref:terminase small subunit n=1 Tax=Zavarzinella formosa TaxID=360055 RepID=UPI0003050C44|nr:terminase small subunit [Zavarzinella formosa]
MSLTPKQETFAQKYIELGNATEAYYAAYDAAGSKPITANRAAKTLLDNPKIAARLRALREIHQKRHEVTVDTITQELEEARMLAQRTKQPSAAVSASLGKAKLHGLITDKSELAGKDGAPLRFTLALGDAKTD